MPPLLPGIGPMTVTLAEASSLGTTMPGALAAPPPPSAPPQDQPPEPPPDPPPPDQPAPLGGPPSRPPITAHQEQSIGTHHSRSPNKRRNPTHGMSK